jgi:anhydro-N-acetylmuramic acid kinase
MLNIGGIANFTFLPENMDASKVFSTDVGPGNTIMDALIQLHFPGKYFDDAASVAKTGKINIELLNELKGHSFFKGSFPKTIGPELFNLSYLEKAKQRSGTESLSVQDQLATLNRFSADMITDAIKRSIADLKNFSLYVSGGGMHNPLLMENIKSQLPDLMFFSTSDLQIHPDAKEAVLFALLANECVSGEQLKMGEGRNKIPNITMGKISFPG